MSDTLVRARYAAVAVKTESTKGTDAIAGSPSSSDFIAANCEPSFDQTTVPDPQYTGSLDNAPPVVTGLRPRVTIRMLLRGSGTAGTAPEFGKLLTACSMKETVTASAVGAPTAAAAGTTSTVTAASPFGNTAQQYQGMPLLLTGTVPDSLTQTVVTNYTTGRVATTLHTVGTPYTTSTTLQVPINVLYSPTSDETVYKTVTIYLYMDGLLWTLVGCTGTWSITLNSGGAAELVFSMVGQFGTKSATAVPAAALSTGRLSPPIFKNGVMRFNGALAQTRSFSLNGGVGTVLPDNPEAVEGYDIGVPIERAMGGAIDPLMNTTNSVSLFTNFRAGTSMRLGGIIGTTAGNRFAVSVPSGRSTQNNPSSRDGLGVNAISYAADAPDAGGFICQF